MIHVCYSEVLSMNLRRITQEENLQAHPFKTVKKRIKTLSIIIRHAVTSHIGLQRKNNEK